MIYGYPVLIGLDVNPEVPMLPNQYSCTMLLLNQHTLCQPSIGYFCAGSEGTINVQLLCIKIDMELCFPISIYTLCCFPHVFFLFWRDHFCRWNLSVSFPAKSSPTLCCEPHCQCVSQAQVLISVASLSFISSLLFHSNPFPPLCVFFFSRANHHKTLSFISTSGRPGWTWNFDPVNLLP